MKRIRLISVMAILAMLICCFGSMPSLAVAYKDLKPETIGLTQACVDASLMQLGDTARMTKLMKKAAAGEEITLGFIGGSITYGSGCIDKGGTKADRFSELVQSWFMDKFPQATVNLVNCGVPATGSLVGIYRAEEDLWQYQPDFVVIEYAVNDGAAYSTQESTEALVRQGLTQGNDAAVMLLMMCTPGGGGSQEAKKLIGEHYDLPMVSYKNGIAKATDLGIATLADFDADGTHPNIKGNAAVALFINHYLDLVYANMNTASTTVKELPAPKYSDAFKYHVTLNGGNFVPKTMGSFDLNTNCSMYGEFKNGWKVTKGGTDAIEWEVSAKRVYLAYQLLSTNSGTLLVSVNDVPVTILTGTASYEQLGAAPIFESDTVKTVKISARLLSGKKFSICGLWVAY